MRLQLNDVRLDVGVVCGQRFHTVGIEALLPNPLEGLLLKGLIRRDAGGDHLFPALADLVA